MSLATTMLAARPPTSERGGMGGGGAFGPMQMGAATTPTSVGAAYAVIQFISRTAAMLPVHVRERGDKSRAEVRTEEFRHIWGRPNPASSRISFWETVFSSVEGWGNAYVWKARDGQFKEDRPWEGITELWHLRPQRVAVGLLPNGDKGFKLDQDDRRPYTTEVIGHVPGLSFDGLRGVSPIEAGAAAHGLSLTLERFGMMLFKNGSSLSGVLLSDAAHDPIKAAEIGEAWAENYSGLNNSHKLAVIGGNAKYQRIGIPPNEAQMLETRGFQREEVLQFYGPVPHHLLGWKSNTSNFGTGIENQGIHLVTYVLLNRLRRVEQWIDDELLPPDLHVKFDVKGLLAGDIKTQTRMLKVMRDAGVLSADGWLELMDMPPREIPDDYTYLGNPIRLNVNDEVQPMTAPDARPSAMLAEALCPTCRTQGHRSLIGKDVVTASLWCSSCKSEQLVRNGTFVTPLFVELERVMAHQLTSG